jgi:polysaccharide deacetylase 2 family uncharacterized protein YibQ
MQSEASIRALHAEVEALARHYHHAQFVGHPTDQHIAFLRTQAYQAMAEALAWVLGEGESPITPADRKRSEP